MVHCQASRRGTSIAPGGPVHPFEFERGDAERVDAAGGRRRDHNASVIRAFGIGTNWQLYETSQMGGDTLEPWRRCQPCQQGSPPPRPLPSP